MGINSPRSRQATINAACDRALAADSWNAGAIDQDKRNTLGHMEAIVSSLHLIDVRLAKKEQGS